MVTIFGDIYEASRVYVNLFSGILYQLYFMIDFLRNPNGRENVLIRTTIFTSFVANIRLILPSYVAKLEILDVYFETV